MSERQALRDEGSRGARLQILSKLVRFAHQPHGALNRQAARVVDRQPELACVALSKLYCYAKQQKKVRHGPILRRSSLPISGRDQQLRLRRRQAARERRAAMNDRIPITSTNNKPSAVIDCE